MLCQTSLLFSTNMTVSIAARQQMLHGRCRQRPVLGQVSLGMPVNPTFADDSPGTRCQGWSECNGCCHADERRGKLREVEHDLREAEQIASLSSIPSFSALTESHHPSDFTYEQYAVPHEADSSESGSSVKDSLVLQIKRMEMEARSFSPDRSRMLLTKA